MVASVLQNLGLKHSVIKFTLYVGRPFFRRNQKAGINWRTARQLDNLGLSKSEPTTLVSVTNPVPVKLKVLEKIYSHIRQEEYLIAHMPYSNSSRDLLKSAGLKSICIIRDPRDMVLSLLDHVETRPQHPMHKHMYETLETKHARIEALLSPGSVQTKIRLQWRRCMTQWPDG